VKKAADWPRYMTSKPGNNGPAFYWSPASRDRKAGCPIDPEALGKNYEAATARSRFLNEHLDAWREGRDVPKDAVFEHRTGSIDWWHHEYFAHETFKRLKPRTQADYREALATVADLPTSLKDAKTGEAVRTGTLPAASLSLPAVDRIYERLRDGGRVNRQADYAMDVARRAWRVVSRKHPGMFLVPVTGPDGKLQRLSINPFAKMIRADYERDTAKPATRAEALALAEALEKIGHPALAAGALICFEWLQRPADVVAGRLTWTDYKPADRPHEAHVYHHKTGQRAWQPLTTIAEDGAEVRLYPELEDRIDALSRAGVPIVVMRPARGPKDAAGLRPARTYSASHAQHLVQKARKLVGLPVHVTLEACRHGGMTELGDCGLTEQEIMSLSTHTTPAAARLYVKRTEAQRLQAAVKRRASVDSRTKSG
jgi:hypothetical protein